ncbi:serine/threonine-protein kinase [Colwellia sp. RE-S-Sl-9]
MDINQSDSSIADDKTLVAGFNSKQKSNEINLIGKCLKDRYVIESQLGSGGMSDIYRAKDLNLESAGIDEPYVAIKVLLQQFSSISEAKQVLVKEAYKTQQLSHPNIIRVYDVDSHDNFHFIVMEWLDGETLEQVIKRSKPLGIPFKGAYKLIEQIGNALTYAHHMGIIHTDLKPSNIMLTRKGDIKVFDFGVARALQLNVDKYALQNHEQSSPLSGYTPAYASYEQIQGQSPCASDDVYAFSCIVYELLSCKHPYQRITADKVDLKQTPLNKPSNLNWYLWPALKKGLALKQEQRCENIQVILNKFSQKLWPKLAIGTAASLIFIAGVQTYLAKNTTIDHLTAEIQLSDKKNQELQNLEKLSTVELLRTLDTVAEKHQLLKHGLLREHRQKILDIVEKRIVNVPKGPNGIYKNYDEIELIIDDALNIFPDSFRLQQLYNQSQMSRQATTDALSDRLNLLLTQGRYSEEGDNNIEKIINDLFFVDSNYKFQPQDEAFKLFQSNFDSAINIHDASKISELIKIGELAFNHYANAKSLLMLGKEMEASVNLLSDYREKIIAGEKAPYPYDAAEVFYRSTFEQLTSELLSVNDSKELEKLDENVMRVATQVPQNFDPLVIVTKKMAASYLNFANESMEKKRFKTAQKLIKRGNELYAMVN